MKVDSVLVVVSFCFLSEPYGVTGMKEFDGVVRRLRQVEQDIHEVAWASLNRMRVLSIADSTSSVGKQTKETASAASNTGSTTATTTTAAGGSSGDSTTASGGTTSSTTATSTASTLGSGTSTSGDSSSGASASGANTSGTSPESISAGGSSTGSTNGTSTKGSTAMTKNTASTIAATNATAKTVSSTKNAGSGSNTTSTDSTSNTDSSSTSDSSSSSTSATTDKTKTLKNITSSNPYAIPIGDDDSFNETYPFFHYDDIQRESNDTEKKSNANLASIASDALQKNLSTTKTPFLPSEKEQPEEWPKIVGGLFLAVALGLIIVTIVRNIRNRNKRRNYEEIQNLVV